MLPRYLFAKPDIIASFDADFLGSWISPVEYTSAYSEARAVGPVPPVPRGMSSLNRGCR